MEHWCIIGADWRSGREAEKCRGQAVCGRGEERDSAEGAGYIHGNPAAA